LDDIHIKLHFNFYHLFLPTSSYPKEASCSAAQTQSNPVFNYFLTMFFQVALSKLWFVFQVNSMLTIIDRHW